MVDAFIHGLSEAVKDELLTWEIPDELDLIIALAIRVDTGLEDRKRLVKPRSPPQYFTYHRRPAPSSPTQRAASLPATPTTSGGEPEVMISIQFIFICIALLTKEVCYKAALQRTSPQ